MKTRIKLFTILCLTFRISVIAQPCSNDDLLKQPGHWITAKPIPSNEVSATDLTRQRSIYASISQTVQQKYSPKGIDIEVRNANMQSNRLADHKIPSGNFYTVDWTFVKHDCPYNRALIDKKLSGAYGIDVIRLHINDFAFDFGQIFFLFPSNPMRRIF